MKTLAFLISLIIVQGGYALDAIDADLIDEFNLVPTSIAKFDEDWDVNSSKLDKDEFKFKGQDRNTTQWDSIDPIAWFDLNTWIKNREVKDRNESWKQKFREVNHFERIGKVIKCIGVCEMYRGSRSNSIEYNSNLFEGDEVYTLENSALWVMLIDGTIVRFSAKTSVSFMEVNISKKKLFILSRLNFGHIHYETRESGEYLERNLPETDLAFLPLMEKRANREFYMIKEYRRLDEVEKLEYSIVKNPGFINQYKELNNYITANDSLIGDKKSHFFIYTPNATFEGEMANMDISYTYYGKSLVYLSEKQDGFKTRHEEKVDINVTLRGYKEFKVEKLGFNTWYEVDPKGREMISSNENLNVLDAARGFTKRIPSLYLLREIWLKEKFAEVFKTDLSFKKYAQLTGYRIWDELSENEMNLRNKFVHEYTRRVETTNLATMSKLYKKTEEFSYPIDRIKTVMAKHYMSLRTRYSKKRKLVREMTDTQYSLWVLRYAK